MNAHLQKEKATQLEKKWENVLNSNAFETQLNAP
jgi:hypothetical protein